MKYILVRGASHEGKSHTMDGVRKALNPSRIQRLNTTTKTLEDFDMSKEMHNGSFVLEVNGKIILISAGSPTEQSIQITGLIELVILLKGEIDFAIVSMRSYEKKSGFDTPAELAAAGDCILDISIEQVAGDYKNSVSWRSRINNIVEALKSNGLMVRTGEEVAV